MTMPGPGAPPAPPTPPTPPPAADPPAPDRTFTQAELDRVVGERLARERTTKYADYDDIKAKAARFDELEASQKTELEKERAAREASDKKAADAVTRANDALMRSAVIAAASKANVVDADAAFALIDKSKLTVSDDGSVIGVDDTLKALLVERPFLVGKATSPTPTGDAGGGARGDAVPGQLTRDELKGMTSEQIVKAKAEGRLNTLMGIA